MKKSHWLFALLLGWLPQIALAQEKISTENWLSSPGIIGTFILIAIVLVVAVIILLFRMNSYIDTLKSRQIEKNNLSFDEKVIAMEEGKIDRMPEKRKAALRYQLKGDQLGGQNDAVDEKGIIHHIQNKPNNAFFDENKRTTLSIETPVALKKLVIYYIDRKSTRLN